MLIILNVSNRPVRGTQIHRMKNTRNGHLCTVATYVFLFLSKRPPIYSFTILEVGFLTKRK